MLCSDLVFQMSLEQFTLLGREVVSQFCEQLSKIIARRVPENAPYAARFVQLLSKPLSVHPAEIVALLEQSLRPLRRAILSQSLSRMFKMVDTTLMDNNFGTSLVDRVAHFYDFFHHSFIHYQNAKRTFCMHILT